MAGESTWRKMKLALRLNTCLDASKSSDDDELDQSMRMRSSGSSDVRHRVPTTPTPTSSGLRLLKSGDKTSTEKICAICLMPMKATCSHLIYTAECSHSFHFHCIKSNVKHGNRACPICRAKWKEIPVENPCSCVHSHTNTNPWSHQDHTRVFNGMPPHQLHAHHFMPLLFQPLEPPIFDDDEEVYQKSEDMSSAHSDSKGGIEMKTYPEVSAVASSTRFDNFGILINIKAPISKGNLDTRAPLDLVTMLDVSGSMMGTKISLLKQAMGFVVQNLGPRDRLSVIAFSSTACRVFPLRRMTETGKEESLQVINSLVADGGTNISEALKKGVKVMTDRKFKNPVSSMILLSDGQDTYHNISPRKTNLKMDYRSLLSSIQVEKENRMPIHTFGFGMDHDACALHSISEHSGGMFSFIEDENVIQDAFAQCIGGLLSVVVQELCVEVECVHPVLRLKTIKAGSYKVNINENGRSGSIEVGDLYAEEERDFLAEMDIPVHNSKWGNTMSLVKFRCIHKDPIKNTVVTVVGNEDLIILRPESSLQNQIVLIEVDRQRNRFMAADAIAKARTMAEHGNLTEAMSVLEECRKKLADSVLGRGGDRLCVGLMAELGEMKERMASRKVYESTGRAYMLSGLSSHSWQRATARGDSTETTSVIQSYQTQTMVDMVSRSQTMAISRSPSTSMVSPKTAPLETKKSLRSMRSFT